MKKHEIHELPYELKPLLKLAEGQGWEHSRTSGGHHKLINPDGKAAITSGTPSDHRSFKNFRAELKRLGLRPYLPIKEDKQLSEPKLVVSKVEGDSTTPVAAVAPVVKVKGVRKMRSMKDAILRATRTLDKEEGADADEIHALVVKEVPGADRSSISASLSYYRAQGMITKTSFGRYLAVQKNPAPPSNYDDTMDVLEEALAVLAKLEKVVKRLKEQRAQIEAARAVFNAIK